MRSILNRSLGLILLFFLVPILAVGQDLPKIDVAVTGLEQELHDNVLRRLTLARHQNDGHLTERQVRRFYRTAESEIASALEPFGYYSPIIQPSLSREKDGWKAEFHIDPGEPVRVTDLDIKLSGPGRADPALVAAVESFPLSKGDVFDHQRYETGKRRMTSVAIEAGYREVVFIRQTVAVSREKHTAGIMLTMDSGHRYLFGATTFQADFLSHRLLQRILPYAQGDPFSPRLLIELRQAMLSSDYFSDVEVSTGSIPEGTFEVPVFVKLHPKDANTYGFGLGYGTDTGTRGSIEWTNRRLNWYGHQLNLQLQPSERKSYFGGVYTIPIRNPRQDRLAFLAKWEKEDFENTHTELRKLTFGYDHIRSIGEYSIYLAYLDENYDTGLESGHATLLMPGLRTTWRFADDRLATRRGIRFTLDLTGADRNVLSDATFLQAQLASKAVYAFFEDWRFIGRFQLGTTLIDNIYDLPPSLRFYTGGDQSVRGYAYKSIGPEDKEGNVIGGRNLVNYSVELERILFDNWSAALFFDSGDSFNSVPDLAMQYGAGAGIRWSAPFGQIRLDIATPLSEGGGSWRIHFNVGADL